MTTTKKQHEPVAEVNYIIFDGLPIRIKNNGYLSGTDLSVKYQKRLIDWLKVGDNAEEILAFGDMLNLQFDEVFYHCDKTDFDKLEGYWMHPGVAYQFLSWCGVKLQTAFGLCYYAEKVLMQYKGLHLDDNFL
jgi:hypothetical protein